MYRSSELIRNLSPPRSPRRKPNAATRRNPSLVSSGFVAARPRMSFPICSAVQRP